MTVKEKLGANHYAEDQASVIALQGRCKDKERGRRKRAGKAKIWWDWDELHIAQREEERQIGERRSG